MLHQGIPGHPPDDPAVLKQAVLDLILNDARSLWALSELDRALQPSGEARSGEEPSRARVEDALAGLYAAGLIHRLGQFAFATRAALEAECILA
jgi:hypothetical protein